MSGLDLIKQFEGLKLEAYVCPAGKLTIGYGHTNGVKSGQTITKEQAEDLVKQDYDSACKDVLSLVKVPINQNQLGALASFVFNLGKNALMGSTLLRMLNSGNYRDAAMEFGKWVFAKDPKTGLRVVLSGLERRRKAERTLFESK